MRYKDSRNHDQLIKKTIENFYQSFYEGDRLLLYRHLTTGFQKNVPLNYFLVHSDYDADFGRLKQIDNIKISRDARDRLSAKAEVTAIIRNKEVKFGVDLKMDFGGWKIEGDSLFRI